MERAAWLAVGCLLTLAPSAAGPGGPDVWRYTFQAPSDGWMKPGFDDSSWKQGPAGFGALGIDVRVGTGGQRSPPDPGVTASPQVPARARTQKERTMALTRMIRRRRTAGARRAAWSGRVVAEAAETTGVDGYEYFPPESVDWDLLVPSDHTSVCPWKGRARYYDLVSGDRRLPGAAWSYPEPSPAAVAIAGHVAFWR